MAGEKRQKKNEKKIKIWGRMKMPNGANVGLG